MMQDSLLNSGEVSMEHMLVPNPSRPSSSSSPNILQQSPATDNQRPRGKPNSSNSDQQALKCPRCESTNTKFCYYNNYSSQQPRHFCKNCRRYWTHGGALRNVPPGGGCRKNKRAKQRLAGLDVDGTSDILAANLHNGCSPLLPNFAFPGSTLNDEHNRMLRFALSASSQDQSMIRLSDESCRGFSNHLFDDLQGAAVSSLPPYPSLIHMASSFDHHGLFNNMSAGAIKAEPEALLPYHGCGDGRRDLGFQDPSSVMQISGSATATIASFEEQLSSFSNDSLESELRTQQQAKLPVHLSADEMFMPSSLNMNLHDTKALNGLLDGQNDWQQQTVGASIDEGAFDSHHHTCHTSRWLDQMQSRTSTTMASAMH